MDGSGGGRGGRSGKGKSRKGKKQAIATGASRAHDKSVRSALQGGKKGGAAGQSAELTDSPTASVSKSLSARQVDSGNMATIVPAEPSTATTNKTKRQRPKKTVGQQQTMITKNKKKKKKGEVTSEGGKQNKKRKRNVSATCKSTGGTLATVLKEGGELAVKNKLRSVSPPLVQKPTGGFGVKHAATKGNKVEATNSTGTIAQVRETSAKPQVQQALKREHTKTDSSLVKPRLLALPSTTAKKVKAKLKVGAARSSGILTPVLEKSLVTVKKHKPEDEAQEVAKARTSKSTATRAGRAHQQSSPQLQPKAKVQQVAVEAKTADSTATRASRAHQQSSPQLQPKAKVQQVAVEAKTADSTATRASRAHQQSSPQLQPKAKVQQVAVEAKAADSTATRASRAHQQSSPQLQPKAKVQQVAVEAKAADSTATRASRSHQQSSPQLQPKAKVQQVAVEAKAADSTAMRASGAQQPLPQIDAAIAARRKCDTTTTASRVEVATTEDSSANTDINSPSTTIGDNVVCPSSESSTSTTDVAMFSTPSPAVLSTGTVCDEHISEEPGPSGATDTLLDTIETSRAMVVNDSSRQLTTTQLVSSPPERSQASVGYKRQLSHGRGLATSVTPLQPPLKRRAVASKLADDIAQATGPDETQPSANQAAAVLDHALNRRGPEAAGTAANTEKPHALAKSGEEDEPESSVSADTPTLRSAVVRLGVTESSNPCRPSASSTQRLTDSMPLRPSERSSVQIQAMSSKDLSPFANESERLLTTKEDVSVTTLSTDGQVGAKSAAASIESNVKATDTGVVMDIPVNLQGARSMEPKTRSRIGNAYSAQAVQPTVSLAPRPRNAWGASFGLVPPARDVSSVSRTLSATPLSSWFLSNGCANFVKQVHFSDDDADDDSCSSSDEVSSTGGLVIINGVDKASFKRRASITKKNAFLGSLLTQSHWRSWYGSVDPHNLLDPPLSHVPEKLRNHEVTVLSAPEETIGNDSSVFATKKGELESLEADIRREKQRGFAFGEQLLMMLRGKTVSGKSLEEEYGPLLQ
ncbi:unnamed protein product [Hyaloperonospora brassicae]|uniref:Uncharacterized protein n=1 Tax=Hyaloperonospora brassicae TaxID=162125 RepID=A0AAV0TF37_HYABA|nr:unnamed protein product [Hyaloperonospora brassicae]